MDKYVFLGYRYGKFESDDGKQVDYCNVYLGMDMEATDSAKYNCAGMLTNKYSCQSPSVFADIPVGSKVTVGFNAYGKVTYMRKA